MTAFVAPEECRMWSKRKWIPCDGLCCFHCRRILLNARQTDEEIAHTLFHEGSHASLGEEGGERVILGIEAGIWAVARALGATLPAFPTGFAELRASAQRAA